MPGGDVGQRLLIDPESMREAARGLSRDYHALSDVSGAIRRALAQLAPPESARSRRGAELAAAADDLIQSFAEPARWLRHYADEVDSRFGGTRPTIEQLPELPPIRPLPPPARDEPGVAEAAAEALARAAASEISAVNGDDTASSVNSESGPPSGLGHAASTLFVSACLEKAGIVPPVPAGAAVGDWVAAAEAGRDGFSVVSGEQARRGDLIAYAWFGTGDASLWDHLAVVEAHTPEGQLRTIQVGFSGDHPVRHHHAVPWAAARSLTIIRPPVDPR